MKFHVFKYTLKSKFYLTSYTKSNLTLHVRAEVIAIELLELGLQYLRDLAVLYLLLLFSAKATYARTID